MAAPCLLGSRVYADDRPRNVVTYPCRGRGLGLFLCHGRENRLDEDDGRLLACRHAYGGLGRGLCLFLRTVSDVGGLENARGMSKHSRDEVN